MEFKKRESDSFLGGVFIDTNIFVSLANKRDQDHKRGSLLMDRVRRNEFGQPYTSDYVLDEALTAALVRTGRIDVAINTGKMILGSEEEAIPAIARFIRVDERILSKSWNNFKQGKYKKLSFTDHTILSQMKEFGIDTLLSFDSNFDGLVSRVH